jgi:hypothetical protein
MNFQAEFAEAPISAICAPRQLTIALQSGGSCAPASSHRRRSPSAPSSTTKGRLGMKFNERALQTLTRAQKRRAGWCGWRRDFFQLSEGRSMAMMMMMNSHRSEFVASTMATAAMRARFRVSTPIMLAGSRVRGGTERAGMVRRRRGGGERTKLKRRPADNDHDAASVAVPAPWVALC